MEQQSSATGTQRLDGWDNELVGERKDTEVAENLLEAEKRERRSRGIVWTSNSSIDSGKENDLIPLNFVVR